MPLTESLVDNRFWASGTVGACWLAGVMDEGIEDMSGAELLDHVGALGREQRRCEVRILLAAVQHAILHDGCGLDPREAASPGREQSRQYGGPGTPRVAEFAAAEFGARLGLTTHAGRELIADALDLAHRLPQLWRRVQALEVKASYARFVARRTRDLPVEQAAHVDGRVVESADGRIPWSRFETLVEAAIVGADPDAAAAREDAAATEQFARPTRSDEHGMRGFYVRAPFAVIARLDATVAFVAEALGHLGDDGSVDERRVKALLLLANPAEATRLLRAYAGWKDRPTDADGLDPGLVPQPHSTTGPGEQPEIDRSRLLPAVTLFVHLYGGLDTDGVARVDGMGPVTDSWVRRHLSPLARVTIRPVLDLAGLAPVDAYEIPERHRQAVQLMTLADTFPFSSSLSRSHQIDHTEPYRHGTETEGAGQSRLGIYGPMTTTHHRIKTFGRWQVRQPFAGLYVWRDPHGTTYLVDHTGTRELRPPTRGRPASRLETAFADLVLDLAA